MTYRTGNVAGFPLPAIWQGDAIVAVVVNGDQALAARICALLNGTHTPDVDHARGTLEALTAIRGLLDHAYPHLTETTAWAVRTVAAELGADGDAPSNAEQPTAVDCRCLFCRSLRGDAPSGRAISPQAAQNGPAVGQDTSGPESISAGSGIVHLIRQDYGTTGCCYRTPTELPLGDRLTLKPDAVTCGLVPRHGAVI